MATSSFSSKSLKLFEIPRYSERDRIIRWILIPLRSATSIWNVSKLRFHSRNGPALQTFLKTSSNTWHHLTLFFNNSWANASKLCFDYNSGVDSTAESELEVWEERGGRYANVWPTYSPPPQDNPLPRLKKKSMQTPARSPQLIDREEPHPRIPFFLLSSAVIGGYVSS